MSTFEYQDLYEKSQNNLDSKYQVFTFDIKNSKQIGDSLLSAHNGLDDIVNKTYFIIDRMNKDALLKDLEQSSMFPEPFSFGDMRGFTINNGVIPQEEVIDIFEYVKFQYSYNFDVHIGSVFYETNNIQESSDKFYRLYAIDYSSKLHKKQVGSRVL